MTQSHSSATQSIAEIENAIRAAIAGKIALQAIYDGPGALIVPTYAGLRQRGEVRILRLQIGGESASGLRREDGDWLFGIGKGGCTK